MPNRFEIQVVHHTRSMQTPCSHVLMFILLANIFLSKNRKYISYMKSERLFILTMSPPVAQSIARSIFQLSRRDREFLPFSLMLRDEIENFCLSVSCFETRSRISSLQSHASRRDREFLSFGLVLRDEIEIQLGVSGNTPRRDCGVCLKLLAPWTVVID